MIMQLCTLATTAFDYVSFCECKFLDQTLSS